MAGINKFTQKAKRVLSLAQQEAEDEGAPKLALNTCSWGLVWKAEAPPNMC